MTSPTFPKPWQNALAEVFLADWHGELLVGDDGRPELVVTKFARTRRFGDLAELQHWLAQIGAPAAAAMAE